MNPKENKYWSLKAFLDSLILELDKVQDNLAVKSVVRPLTYTVKDVALDLQIFPDFDGKRVRFNTAKSGETGASKISVQLGSISDRQVRETTKAPITEDDLSIETIEEIDDETKESLQRMGVNSVKDLEKMEKKKIDIEKVSGRKIDYSKLARLVDKNRRGRLSPRVGSVSLSQMENDTYLTLNGDNLVFSQSDKTFPIVALNDELAEILSADQNQMMIKLKQNQLHGEQNKLEVALDPYTLFKIELKV
jgi:urease accessory protein UreE